MKQKENKNKIYIYISIIGIILIILIILALCKIVYIIIDFNYIKYYYLEINDNNRSKIEELLTKENINYCNSMYKIEYYNVGLNYPKINIYCTNEPNITFSSKHKDELNNYLYSQGKIEKRLPSKKY